MSLWGKYNRPKNPSGISPNDRPDTSQLDAAESGHGILQACSNLYQPSTRPSTSGSRIPAPVGAHRGRQRAHPSIANPFTRRYRSSESTSRSLTRMPAIPHEEHFMSGALPTPPDSGSRATAAGWAAEVSRNLQQALTEDEADTQLRSSNTTPEWCTPRPAPDAYTLADIAAATRRCLYPEEAGPSRPRAARLASNHPGGEPDEYYRDGASSKDHRNTSDRIPSASTKSSQIRSALSRIDENLVTPPPIPTRHHSQISRNQSEQLDSSHSLPETAPSLATHYHSQVYPELPHFAKRGPPGSPSSNPFSDEHAASSSTIASPGPSHFAENFGHAASTPAQLARDPTPPLGQGARVSKVEYVAEKDGQAEATRKRWTLGALQAEFRTMGRYIQEQLMEKNKEATKGDQDKPAPLPRYTYPQIAILSAILLGLTIYTAIALSRQRTGLAYTEWSPGLSNVTLRALDSGTGITSFRASSSNDADMYTISTHTVSLSSQQKEAVCEGNVMPTFNITTQRQVSGMQNLSPRGSGFLAVAVPSFGNAVGFVMVICGVYSALREGLRRGLKRWEMCRFESESVSWVARLVDKFLAWSEIVAIVLGAVGTSLLVSGVVTTVLHR